ncbi:MFS transporter [Microvirga lotononidis]|uniref:Arabinose efflux permease family protein n=1 Tax=Microvirga lotononidis TaxID=864069 RepID=I4YVA0_9HYPH|nr:MFS transporter [Microvirga lotononidis]EIM27892.1 arabinose efflux permease family protein [Microvirga lotononidis]WQO27981.1 MFS transporter [Microvirga lotononidis]
MDTTSPRTSPAAGITDGLPNPERLLAFLAIAIALTMAVLDSAIVNVALPVMARELQVDPATTVWAVNAYQLAITVSLLPLASLGDSLGYRRIYWAGLLVFTLSSLGCALAGSFPMLIAARVLQGFGAAGIMSVNIALVRFIYPSKLLGRGVGNTALVVAISSAAGPTVAAAILSVASWSWLFLINVPLGIFALIVAARTLPDTPRSARRLDGWSVGLNALTFGLLITGIDALSTGSFTYPFIAIAGAVVAGFVFVRYQLSLAMPLLPLDLLRLPVFALSMMTSICSFATQALATLALPFYFHDELGRSVAETGMLMTPWPLAIAVAAPIAGRLADRFSPGLLGGLGLATLSGGLALVAMLPDNPSTADIIWRLTICGLGFGLFQSPNNKAIITSAPPERSGGASGMQSSARLVGQSLGAAMAAVLFGLVSGSPTTIILWLGACLSLIGCVTSSLRILRGGRPSGR